MKSKTEIQNKLNLTEAKPSLIQSKWLSNHQGSPLNAPMHSSLKPSFQPKTCRGRKEMRLSLKSPVNRYITKLIIETYISIRKGNHKLLLKRISSVK